MGGKESEKGDSPVSPPLAICLSKIEMWSGELLVLELVIHGSPATSLDGKGGDCLSKKRARRGGSMGWWVGRKGLGVVGVVESLTSPS